MKIYMFFGNSFLRGFGVGFGGAWKTKIINFRTFFIVFSMQTLECKLEGHFGGQKGDLGKLPGYVGTGSVNGGGPLATPRAQRVQRSM